MSKDGGGTPDDRTGCFLSSAFTPGISEDCPANASAASAQPRLRAPKSTGYERHGGTRPLQAQSPICKPLASGGNGRILAYSRPCWLEYCIEGCLLGGPTPSCGLPRSSQPAAGQPPSGSYSGAARRCTRRPAAASRRRQAGGGKRPRARVRAWKRAEPAGGKRTGWKRPKKGSFRLGFWNGHHHTANVPPSASGETPG